MLLKLILFIAVAILTNPKEAKHRGVAKSKEQNLFEKIQNVVDEFNDLKMALVDQEQEDDKPTT